MKINVCTDYQVVFTLFFVYFCFSVNVSYRYQDGQGHHPKNVGFMVSDQEALP